MKLKAYMNIEIELDMPKGRYWNIDEDGNKGPANTRGAGRELLSSIIAEYLRTVEDDNGELQIKAMDDFIEDYFGGSDQAYGFRPVTEERSNEFAYNNVGNVYVKTKFKIGKKGKWHNEDFMNMNLDDWS